MGLVFFGSGNRFSLGDSLRFNADFIQMNGRAEWIGRLSDRVRIIGGLDIDITPFTLDYVGPPIQQAEGSDPGNSGEFGDQENLRKPSGRNRGRQTVPKLLVP